MDNIELMKYKFDRRVPQTVNLMTKILIRADIDLKALSEGYNPPDVGSLLKAIDKSNMTADGNFNY